MVVVSGVAERFLFVLTGDWGGRLPGIRKTSVRLLWCSAVLQVSSLPVLARFVGV